MSIDYAVQIIWSPEDGAYIAMPAELPGCMADGQTQEEALANLKVVIAEWIETAKSEGRQIPQPATVEDVAQAQREAHEQAQQQIRVMVENEAQKVAQSVLQVMLKERTFPFSGLRLPRERELAFGPFQEPEFGHRD